MARQPAVSTTDISKWKCWLEGYQIILDYSFPHFLLTILKFSSLRKFTNLMPEELHLTFVLMFISLTTLKVKYNDIC